MNSSPMSIYTTTPTRSKLAEISNFLPWVQYCRFCRIPWTTFRCLCPSNRREDFQCRLCIPRTSFLNLGSVRFNYQHNRYPTFDTGSFHSHCTQNLKFNVTQPLIHNRSWTRRFNKDLYGSIRTWGDK